LLSLFEIHKRKARVSEADSIALVGTAPFRAAVPDAQQHGFKPFLVLRSVKPASYTAHGK
jgi:hypothetical protein